MKRGPFFIIGGHSSPAFSVIDSLKRKNEEIYFLGRKHPLEGEKSISLEYEICRKKNILFLPLTTGRLQRKISLLSFFSLLKIPIGFLQSFYYFLKFRPKIVISFGSYLSLPPCLVAKIFQVPVIIHEQTFSAGLANRLIAPLANKVLISFPSSFKYFPKKKTILTGNPIRREVFINKPVSWQKAVDRPFIYITGGSLGSHKINFLIAEILPFLLKKFYIIHQIGASLKYKDYDNLLSLKNKLPEELAKKYFPRKFLYSEEIGWVLNNADLIISRCGINTLSEILILKKPAILIPLPFSLEQKENAEKIKDFGDFLILNQEKISPKILLKEIFFFYEKVQKIKKSADFFHFPKSENPTTLIIKEIYGCLAEA